MKRDEDLANIADVLKQSRLQSKATFERQFARRLRQESFKFGDLVLVRNSQVEKKMNRKHKPRYLGPYEVVRQTRGGLYVLRELNGTQLAQGRAGTGLRQIHDISHAKISVSPIVTSGLHAVTIRGTAREVGDALSAIGKRIAHRCIRNPRSKKPKQPPAPTAAPPTLVVEPPSSTPTSSSTPTTRTPRSGTASPHLPIPTAVDTRSSPSSSFAPGLPMEVDALRAPQQHSDGYSRPGPVQPREGIQTARRGGGPPCVFGANRPR
uniref:Uncharacterized protein n=1 Tax=Psilocybe cubensis TaxID=181762 RepID=A0A8H8CHK6_PSICU